MQGNEGSVASSEFRKPWLLQHVFEIGIRQRMIRIFLDHQLFSHESGRIPSQPSASVKHPENILAGSTFSRLRSGRKKQIA